MINAFESKWNTRLLSLTTPTNNVDVVQQLLPIVKDLNTTYQQFNQQNVHMQRSLGSVTSRVQDIQTKLTNGSTVQNGH
jgi:hypothetical protein